MRSQPLKRKTPLRKRSQSASRKRRETLLYQAKRVARDYWGERCLVPGCNRPGTQLHHAYGRGSYPQHREEPWNLVPLCGGVGTRAHHSLADDASHWLHWACREIADEVRACMDGRRPLVARGEVEAILRRYREEADRPHSSLMGAAD